MLSLEKEKGDKKKDAVFSAKEYLQFLITGMLPFLGVFLVLQWAFNGKEKAEKQNLGKAMLWIHGAFLLLLLCGLCIWVITLARASLGAGL